MTNSVLERTERLSPVSMVILGTSLLGSEATTGMIVCSMVVAAGDLKAPQESSSWSRFDPITRFSHTKAD